MRDFQDAARVWACRHVEEERAALLQATPILEENLPIPLAPEDIERVSFEVEVESSYSTFGREPDEVYVHAAVVLRDGRPPGSRGRAARHIYMDRHSFQAIMEALVAIGEETP
jgi:hypothetical protein